MSVLIPPSTTGPARIVVLLSGTGSTMEAVLRAGDDPSYGARIVAVGADRAGTRGVSVAERAGVATFVCEPANHACREEWNEALREAVRAHSPDIVLLAGFLKLLSPAFLDAFPQRVVNTHNALLPSFPGIHAPAEALAHGVKVTGATLFVVDPGVDTGAILAQTACPVLEGDTEETLLERIKGVERRQLVETIGKMARSGWWVEGRHAGIGAPNACAR